MREKIGVRQYAVTEAVEETVSIPRNRHKDAVGVVLQELALPLSCIRWEKAISLASDLGRRNLPAILVEGRLGGAGNSVALTRSHD